MADEIMEKRKVRYIENLLLIHLNKYLFSNYFLFSYEFSCRVKEVLRSLVNRISQDWSCNVGTGFLQKSKIIQNNIS